MNMFSRLGYASASSTSRLVGRVALLGAITLVVGSTAAMGDYAHALEIKAFASTMAVARTVKENCPGTSIDDYYLETLRLRLHVVEADHSAFALEAHAAAEVFKQALAEAASPQAWCNSVYRLYGPDGKLIPGLLSQ